MTRLYLTALITAKDFLTRKQEGATMVEYGLMVALIAAFCAAIVGTLGTSVKTAFTNANGAF